MVEIIVVGILAAVVGGVVGAIAYTGKFRKRIDILKGELFTISKEKILLQAQLETANQMVEKEKAVAQQMLAQQKESLEKLMQEHKEQYMVAMDSMRNQIKSISEDVLSKRSEELKKSNVEQLGSILNPMKEQMSKMEQSVQKVNADSAAHKAAITQTIENLAKETIKVGEQADGLAKALKSKGKVQGDWGEQVLENILENSGLRKDHEYFIQRNVKGEDNSNIRPDVIVKCPGNKSIVIDSKVSLTAYIDYVNAETEQLQQQFAKANRDSVKSHIDELAAVNYSKYVENTIEHVLMFVPNEGSYILALQSDPALGQYAFKKGVLLINPTNLMMSLQLIYNIWQSERQARNVETIVSESEALYEKFVVFLSNFTKLKKDIESISKTYEAASGQLSGGRGNIIKKLENLKTLGVTPKKQIDAEYLESAE